MWGKPRATAVVSMPDATSGPAGARVILGRRGNSAMIRPLALAAALALCAVQIPQASASEVYPDWSFVQSPPFPLVPSPGENPVLTAEDVTDQHTDYVADPFLMRTDDGWYMFFEAFGGLPQRGSIALATSADGSDWVYDQIVLAEPYHLSYPFVFRCDGRYYMLVSGDQNLGVDLYRADAFPYGWNRVVTLMDSLLAIDPTPLWHDGTWWLFASGLNDGTCRLYFADRLGGPWSAHPLNPIVTGCGVSRPAGRFIVYDGDRVIRLAQKCDGVYGEAVRAFEVTTLSRTEYQEVEIAESPVLQAGGSGWNALGMHQCDPWLVGNHWMAAVDGHGEDGRWSIGIYLSAAVFPSGDPESEIAADPTNAVSVRPDPCRMGLPFTVTVRRADLASPVCIWLCDPSGRCLRTLESDLRGDMLWNGRNATGQLLQSGLYYIHASSEGRESVAHLVLVR